MGPPRGPRGGSAARPAARNATSTRPATRGGIQKKRAAPRADVDGDLDMDGEGRRAKRPAVGGDSSTSSTSRPTRGARGARGGRGTAGGSTRMPSKQAEVIARHLNSGSTLVSRISNVSTRSQRGPVTLVWLKVKGLKESKAASNPGGGLKDLLHFLERKATSLATRSNNRPVAIKQHREQGDYVLVAATSEDSEELLKVNSFTFAGTALSVEIDAQGGPEPSADVKVLRDHLQSILSVRYIGENKLLKLDALSADPAIVQAGLLDSSERAEKMFKALMRVCDDLFKTRKDKSDAIESISVANNSIDNVVSIAVLGDTFPDLQNLDLSGNNISTIDGLRGLRGKFKRLRALYLANNPIEAGQPDYKTTMLEWFPTLQDLNGIQVRTPEQAAAAEAASLPRPFPQGGPDFRDANSIGENFLLDFFTNYDNNRPQIVAKYYDETSAFSLAVDTNSARDPNQPAPLPWAAYLKFSRNLTKITHQPARVQRLFKGATFISELWKSLPASKHPDLKQEVGKYIMDCHVLPGLADPSGQSRRGVDGLIVTIHGEFDEFDQKTNSTGKRSFSRTFILGAGVPGKNPIRVVSDMLSLRAYSPLPNIFAPAQSATPAAPNAEQQQQAAMIAELCKQTGMTPQYAELCLSDASVAWNFDKALIVFNERKANLPPDAFANPGI